MNEYFQITGFASVEITDGHGEIIDIDALDRAMPKFMYENGTLNYEHSTPIGKIISWSKTEKDGKPALQITAILHDNHLTKQIIQEIKSGKLNAFSIRGSALQTIGNVVTELELYEISLVHEPANPEATVEKYQIIKMLTKSKNRTFISAIKCKNMNFIDNLKTKAK